MRRGLAFEVVVFQSKTMQPRLQAHRTGERTELAQVARIDQLLIANSQKGAVIGNDGKLVKAVLLDTQVAVPCFNRAKVILLARRFPITIGSEDQLSNSWKSQYSPVFFIILKKKH